MNLLSFVGDGLQLALVIFFFGFIIFFHELGHLLVALWRGLHVERFSVGFGHAIFKRQYKGVEYIIGWIPLGGYVALPQLDAADEIPKTFDGEELPVAGPVDRILVAVAGPAFNVILGFLLAIPVWYFGVTGPPRTSTITVAQVMQEVQTVEGTRTESPEYAAGLQSGDVITAINGKTFRKGWEQAQKNIIFAKSKHIVLDITRDGKPMTIEYDAIPSPRAEGLWVPNFRPMLLPEVNQIVENSPAFGKVELGDLITAVNGKPVYNSDHFMELLAEQGGSPVTLSFERDGAAIPDVTLTPEWINSTHVYERYLIGIGTAADNDLTISYVSDQHTGPDAPQVGDKILALNDGSVSTLSELKAAVARSQQAAVAAYKTPADPKATDVAPGVPVALTVQRNDATIHLTVTPSRLVDQSGYKLGLGVWAHLVVSHPSPWDQWLDTVDTIKSTVSSLANRQSSVKFSHMSTFPGIVMVLKTSFSQSFVDGLKLVVFINFMLAIVNMFPIPILDGGHISFGIIELITRRRLPVAPVRWLQYAFMTLLLGFMVYVMYYDIARIIRNYLGGSETVAVENSKFGEHLTPPEGVSAVAPSSTSAVAPATPADAPPAEEAAAPAEAPAADPAADPAPAAP